MGMIHIKDEYYIRSDEYGYTLCRQTETVNKKTGEKKAKMASVTYHGDIADCIKSYVRVVLKGKIEDAEDMELKQMLDMIEQYRRDGDRLIEELTGGE